MKAKKDKNTIYTKKKEKNTKKTIYTKKTTYTKKKVKNNKNNTKYICKASTLKKENKWDINYPYWKYTLPSIDIMIKNIENIKLNSINGILIRKYPLDYIKIDGLSNYFTEDVRIDAQFKTYESPRKRFKEIWNNMSHIEKTKFKNMKPYNLREEVYKSGREANTFNLALGYWIYTYFGSQGSSIYDPSSGWGDRAIAAITSGASSYYGFDPNPRLHPAYNRLIKTLKTILKNKINGKNVNIPKNGIINSIPNIIFCQFNPDIIIDKVDIILTSPPFYDLEVYVGNNEEGTELQSIKNKNTYKQWMNEFLVPYYKNAWDNLRDGGWFVAYVENAKSNTDFIPLRTDTKQILKNFGGIPGPAFGLQVIADNEKFKGINKSRWALSWLKPVKPDPYSPPLIFTEILLKNGNKILAVRDDFLPIGTKGRAFPDIPKGIKKIIYTGSAIGYGPLLAAATAINKGLDCLLILDRHPPGLNKKLTIQQVMNLPTVILAKSFKANIKIVDGWDKLNKLAKAETDKSDANYWCPLGFLDKDYISKLSTSLKKAWNPDENLKLQNNSSMHKNNNIYVIGGSGVIGASIAIAYSSMNIKIIPLNDKVKNKLKSEKYNEIIEHFNINNLEIVEPIKIDNNNYSKYNYPIPLTPGYDSKAWDYIVKYGKNGDILWNVARGGNWFESPIMFNTSEIN
jgi:hypothetical protein